jgi:hypothetical protein
MSFHIPAVAFPSSSSCLKKRGDRKKERVKKKRKERLGVELP